MTAETIITNLAVRGVIIAANGEKLKVVPKSALTTADLETLTVHKAELLALLTAPEVPIDDPAPTLPDNKLALALAVPVALPPLVANRLWHDPAQFVGVAGLTSYARAVLAQPWPSDWLRAQLLATGGWLTLTGVCENFCPMLTTAEQELFDVLTTAFTAPDETVRQLGQEWFIERGLPVPLLLSLAPPKPLHKQRGRAAR